MISRCLTALAILFCTSLSTICAQTTVNSLTELNTAMQLSNQSIVLEAGNYELEDLPSNSRAIICSGSDNTIDLTGVRIKSRVGSVGDVYFIISGDNNIFKNGAIEDYYQSGLEEVTDFSTYNNDRSNLANGLGGDPIMEITGDDNLVEGLEMTVKGSFPYGYGSQYGIGSTNTFGLDKRCGILITGRDGGGSGNTLDGITMYHYAFGHGIFMQTGATETTIKNCYVEGRMRLSDDIYNDTETYDLPYRTNYRFPSGDDWRTLPFIESYDIPKNDNSVVYPLSEDGIRSYNSTGSVVVENCTVKQMRGGIRLYLASSATVTNSTAIDCGSGGTNYNMPNGGTIAGSSGNFSFTSLNDNRLSRSNQEIEMTIIPSPNAIGPHNLADVLGNNQDIVFHRTPGPLDSDEERAIVVSGDNSTIVNETEYHIILESVASGNNISTCGPVTDNGSGNSITYLQDCSTDPPACGGFDAFSAIEAEELCETEGASVADDYIGSLFNEDWVRYDAVEFGTSTGDGIEIVLGKAHSSPTFIEIYLDDLTGQSIGAVEVPATGGWTAWEPVVTEISEVTGTHDVYLYCSSGNGSAVANIESFSFIENVACITGFDAFSTIEAERFCEMSGVQTEASSENGENIGYIENGDYIGFNNIDFGTQTANKIEIRVACNFTGGTIEVRTGSPSGSLVGTIPVIYTGGNQDWVTLSTDISNLTGQQNLYLVFTGGDGYLFNINYFSFIEDPTSVDLDIKVFLESCYEGNGTMSNALSNLLPSSEPYTQLGYTFQNGGNEVVQNGVLSQTGDDKVIDWVIVELRDPSDMGTVMESRAGLLLADGDIVDMDGQSSLSINTSIGEAYVAVKHRNHLGVMSRVPVNLTGGSVVVDLTSISNIYTDAELSNAPVKLMTDGVYVLYQGDANNDGEVNSSDATAVFGGSVPVVNDTYATYDVNMDGQLSTTDASKAFENAVPVKKSHIR